MKTLPCILLLLLVAAAPLLGDESLATIRQRMAERQPVLTELWSEGRIGERRDGYVGFPPAAEPDARVRKIVDAENRDRATVYELIAKRSGASVEVVAKHRAADIAARASRGLWLQDAQGRWYRKP